MAGAAFRITVAWAEVHRSARKHGVADEDAFHAARGFLVAYPLSEEDRDGPRRELRLGPDRAGNVLEMVVLLLDDGEELVIHAMRMRAKYRGAVAVTTGNEMSAGDVDRGRTSGGVPVTDEMVERLAEEAVVGFDLSALRRRGGRRPLGVGPGEVVPVRLDSELRAALAARADADDTSASDVIRQALRAWLHVA